MNPSRITLGTAQLGLNYGIANNTGQPNKTEAHQLLTKAYSLGINSFDTAISYGNSEEILGNWIKDKHTANDIYITSKIPSLTREKILQAEVVDFIISKVGSSFLKLGKPIDYCLLHDFTDFLKFPNEINKAIKELKKNHLIDKFGFSLYEPIANTSVFLDSKVEVVQVPINIFNQTFLENDYLKTLQKFNIEIFARSLYLQGLFILSIEIVTTKIPHALPFLDRLSKIADANNLSLLGLAIGFINQISEINNMIIGVDNTFQLVENLAIKNTTISKELFESLIREFSNVPKEVFDPRFWIVKG